MAKVPLRPAKVGVQSPAPAHANAITFGPEHVPAQFFDMTNEFARTWLDSGSQLLRASKAVARQSAIDAGVLRAWFAMTDEGQTTYKIPHRAGIVDQAAFLCALAVENGLKALIVANVMATRPAPGLPFGKLPKYLQCHDLDDLARRAGLTTSDVGEQEALAAGRHIIAGSGRYATMSNASETPMASSMNPQGLFDAYERLFFRCVEEVARTLHPLFGHARAVDEFIADDLRRYETLTGGVSPAWGGEEQIALRGSGTMTLANSG